MWFKSVRAQVMRPSIVWLLLAIAFLLVAIFFIDAIGDVLKEQAARISTGLRSP